MEMAIGEAPKACMIFAEMGPAVRICSPFKSSMVLTAFFTVWIIQRTPDIAILKALGASKSALLTDALGQALIVLVGGVVVGMAVTTFFGVLLTQLAGSAMPFTLSVWTTLAPALLLIFTGLLGAGFALRSVAKADPLTALGATR